MKATGRSGSKRYFLARHGETEWNRERRRQGRLDSPLTPAGKRNAIDIAAAAKRSGVDHVVASPLDRARTTAEVIAESVGCSLSVLNELAEVDHGDFSGYTDEEIEDRWPGALGERAADKYQWRFPGGESYADAHKRASNAVDQIEQTSWRAPLIVSHQMIARMLFVVLLDLPVDVALGTALQHGRIVEVPEH